MSEDDKIKKLPVRFKKPAAEEGRILQVVDCSPSAGDCNHKWFFRNSQIIDVAYLIREGETEVECSNCHTKLDPMWVLRLLAVEENQWQRARQRYQEEMARLNERERTKCQFCGKMTRISQTKSKPK